MTQAAITVHSVSKRYQIGTLGSKYDYVTLREALMGAILRPVRRSLRRLRGEAPGGQQEDSEIWALKNVNFTVEPGEVVGLIGRNGAGKSTLLKVLSRITEPTTGSIRLHGRVASMLEVGTGFHPELTGRENIYLNGAILGMTRAEITRKLDDIVDFAEIARFADTPVKRYSSGMYLRLAFSVAAHLEPEILLVDEVLAVGDFDFQKKCLGKMEDVGRSGRTVIFVSHDIPAVLRLCTRAVMLGNGTVLGDGPTEEICREYMRAGTHSTAERCYTDPTAAPGNDFIRLRTVRICDGQGQTTEVVDIRSPVVVEASYWSFSAEVSAHVCLTFVNENGVYLFTTADAEDTQWRHAPRATGLVTARCQIPGNFFAEGRVFVNVWISSFNPSRAHVGEQSLVSFQVVDPIEGDSVRGEYVGLWPGVLRPRLNWTVEAAR